MINKMGNKPFVLTIDGPAGAGKSTIAKLVAKKLGVPYLDTGAIYRSITWYMMQLGIAPSDEENICRNLKDFSMTINDSGVVVNGTNITSDIRTPEIDKNVSHYAALKCVRDALLELQRKQSEKGIVADGRDMGTIVFPDADLKIFLTASAEERAKRRFDERIAKGEDVIYEDILKQVNDRDNYDMNREIAPLKPALGCIILDCTEMAISEVSDAIISLALEIRSEQ